MNNGKVVIKGQIGTSYNEDGTIETKGVELEDVVEQLEPLLANQEILVEITSQGGLVTTGKAIANYISKFKNVKTIAKEYCCSIATEIHLAVPLENRLIEAGTEYMIHNPLLQNVTGNANELMEWASAIKPLQDDMVKMYAKSTGLTKEAVQGLMNQETSLTDEQAVKLGFASKIVPKIGIKAVALIDKNINSKQINMSKFTEDVKKILVSLGLVTEQTPNGRNAKAMMLPSDKGVLETPYDDLMVGDAVTIDGAPAEDGSYTLEDGTQIVVTAGVISEIIPVADDNEEVMALKKQIEELTAQLTAKDSEIAEVKAEQEKVMEILAKAKLVGSNHVPNAVAYVPNKGKLPTISMKEMAMKEKTNYKPKNK